MEDIRKEIYVVGYWCHIQLVTTNKGLAEQVCNKKRSESPALPYAVRNIENAIHHAYATGLADGEFD